jgi:hypothetical protein
MDAAATSCNPLSFISDWAAVTLETNPFNSKSFSISLTFNYGQRHVSKEI